MKTLAFFNNKGGVGKTSLIYHLAHMMAERGLRVLAVDLDPQANLTAMFLSEEALEDIWPEQDDHPRTLFGALRPILKGLGDIQAPEPHSAAENLWLLPGDLGLSSFEDKLSDAWPRCHNRDEASFRIMTAFHRIMHQVAADHQADLILVDVGPNLGAINRAALIASDHICLPVAPDLYSLQGLRNLGPTLANWRTSWLDLKSKAPADISIPAGSMQSLGYIVMQHNSRNNRPVQAYQKWIDRIPSIYRTHVLQQPATDPVTPDADPHRLALLKHYRSLMPMAMAARKPMFRLKPVDGALGAHGAAVTACHADFLALARRITTALGLQLG
jgi:chromosome partitioning protein